MSNSGDASKIQHTNLKVCLEFRSIVPFNPDLQAYWGSMKNITDLFDFQMNRAKLGLNLKIL